MLEMEHDLCYKIQEKMQETEVWDKILDTIQGERIMKYQGEEGNVKE